MTWSLKVNGIDLATYGFSLSDAGAAFDATERTMGFAPIYGRAGTLATTATEGARTIVLTGTLTSTANTVSARVSNEESIKDLLRSGLVTLQRDDASTTVRQIKGYVTQLGLAPIGHPVAPTDMRMTARIACPDPCWTETEPTSQVLGATRATLALGTAPSSPVVRIMGAATDPVLTYRDAGGTSQNTLTLASGTLNATNDWVDIDMRTGVITKYASGATSSGWTAFVATITGVFPFAFDPQDGDYTTAAWPTLELSSGTGIAYWWKAYL